MAIICGSCIKFYLRLYIFYMKKILSILLLTGIAYTSFGQADQNRFPKTPATGSNQNKTSIRDYNLTAVANLRVPVFNDWSLRNAKDSAGYVMFNSTLGQFGGYNGTTWIPFGGAVSSLTTIGASGNATLSGGVLNIPNYTTDLSNYYNKSQTSILLGDSLANYMKIADGLTRLDSIKVSGLTVTAYAPITWRINAVNYQKLTNSVFNVPAATNGYNRIDLLYATTSNTVLRLQGTETTGIAVAPVLPMNSVSVALLYISGSVIQPPFPDLSNYVNYSYLMNNYYTRDETDGKYIYASPSLPQNAFIDITGGIITSNGKFKQQGGYTEWNNGITPVFTVADANGVGIYDRRFSFYNGSQQHYVENNGTGITFGNGLNPETFQIGFDGNIKIPVTPNLDALPTQVLTRDATTGQVKYVPSTSFGGGGGGGSVTNVSSANSDIGVANPTTTPVLTLNSGTGANQIVKRDGSGDIAGYQKSLTFNNGLTESGGVVKLGGDYTGTIFVGQLAANKGILELNDTGGYTFGQFNDDATAINGLKGTDADTYLGFNIDNSLSQYLHFNKVNGIKINDNLLSKGLYYSADYSIGRTFPADNLWIPNAGWVRSQIAAGGSIPTGTDGQVLGYSSGTPTAVTLGLTQLSDISGIPAFSNGVYAFTGINPTTGAALRSFIEFSTTTPKAGTFPTYGTGGVLPVANGVASGDAVNVSQLSGYVPTTRTVTAGNGVSGGGALSGNITLSADTTGVLATKANTLSLSQIQTRFGSGNFFPQPAVFTGGGTSTSDYFNIIGATGVSGTGAVLMANSPTMVTPTLGAATATSINKVTITAPTTNATLTLAQGNTLQTTGAFTLNLTATANSTPTFPTGTVTLYGTGSGTITSANLATSVSNETGTGALVFGTSPTIATPALTWVQSTKTANYTAVLTDYALFGDATTASFTITLPTASSASGKMYSFKKTDASANTVTIKGNGAELIDGTNTKVISTQYNGFTLMSNGTVWYVLL